MGALFSKPESDDPGAPEPQAVAQFRKQLRPRRRSGQSRCDSPIPVGYAAHSCHMSIGFASRRSNWLSNGLR